MKNVTDYRSADNNSMKVGSISRNLTVSLVFVIVVITMAFISIYYYQISSKEARRLQKAADGLVASIAKTLEVPLWDVDRENIITVCSYFSQNDQIASFSLIGVSGEVFYQNQVKDIEDKSVLIHRSLNIYHNNERLGKVMLSLNPTRSKEVIYELLKVSIAALLVSVVVLVIFTGGLLKKFLKEPVGHISQIAASYAGGDYHPAIEGKSYIEFEPLVSALVEMGNTIETQMKELQRAEKSLIEHRDHLEEMVNQRTKELEITNRDLQGEMRDRMQAQADLKSNKQRLEAILTASPVGIALEIDSRFDWANETMCQMLGYEKDELLGLDIRALYAAEEEQERVGRELYHGITRSNSGAVETQWVRKDNTVFDCKIRACSLDSTDPLKGQILAVSDVSESKYLQAKLQSAKKMEAIGTLAGGVAHDLNNILSGIISYPEVLLLGMDDENPIKKPLSAIKRSGEKAADIVQDLLTMARRGVSVAKVVNLNHILEDQLKSPEISKLKMLHPDVKMTPALDPDLMNIRGSSTHLSKCVMNLISNAAEAMPYGGSIVIETRNRYLDTPVKGHEYIEEGEYVEVSVSDTGLGISQKDIEHIFEPFYTKKKMGRSGTGLGMSVVWGTVKDHKGFIDINSEEGVGTKICLLFPATREMITEDSEEVPVDEYLGNGESILVVDDVPEQREVASVILRKLNYNVRSVSSGEEAVEYMKHHSADLLVLDMNMEPGMDGLDTYRKIIAHHPGQKAIIASGFSRTDRIEALQKIGAGQYIRKPYAISKIGLAIKEALAAD